MAVDSLRETRHINRIGTRDLGILWSAQSYRPDITAALRKIRSMTWRPLADLCINPIGPGPHPTFVPAGHPCLKTKNVLGIVVDATDVDFVDPADAKRWPHYLIDRENLVLNVTGAGSIGRVGMYFGTDRPLTNQHLAKLSIAAGTDAAFVCAFLSSWWGERALEQGVSGSTGQLNLVNDHVRQVPIPVPNVLAQRYIGDKVRQAERLRAGAQRSQQSALVAIGALFPGLTGLSQSSSWVSRASVRDLEDRLDSRFYSPVSLSLEEALKSPTLARSPLASLVHRDREITNGVRGPSLAESKFKLVRLQDTRDWAVDFDGCATITETQFRENGRCRLRPGDVIVAIGGYIGNAAIVIDEATAVIGQHSAVLALDPEKMDPFFLTAYLNSSVGARHMDRFVSGTVQAGINLEDLRRIKVPVPSAETQNKVGCDAKKAVYGFRVSRQLTTAARLITERLIEGHVSEAELIGAQKALEAGDRSADGAILKALRQSDAPGAKPLIADIDELYALLDELEGQDA